MLEFNAMYTRDIDFTKNFVAVQQVHDLMSLFGITDYTLHKSTVTCNKEQAKLPNKQLSDIEKQFAESLNLYDNKNVLI